MHRRESPRYPITCWFCEGDLSLRKIRRDGILRSRSERDGGPFRLYACESCGRDNVCEVTRGGRWFCSPNFRFTFLDFLVSRFLDGEAENLIAAISWFRRHEERRRYFFEQDDDRRYSSGSMLLKLWPLGADTELEYEQSRARERSRRDRTDEERMRRDEQDRRAAEEERRRRADAQDRARARAERRARDGIVTPCEILGVREDAGEREIRLAFQRLAIHYHPDKVHHLGEEFRSEAQKKFLQLKAAYDTLIARRLRQRP